MQVLKFGNYIFVVYLLYQYLEHYDDHITRSRDGSDMSSSEAGLSGSKRDKSRTPPVGIKKGKTGTEPPDPAY